MILTELIQTLFPSTAHWHITSNEIGESAAEIFLLSQNNQTKFVLKCEEKSSPHKLKEEFETLSWLAGIFPVPKVEWYREIGDWACILMQYLPGDPSFQYPEKDLIGTLLGETLRAIHQLPYDDFPDQRNKTERLLKQRLGEPDADKEGLEGWLNEPFDLVFSHGDYCLPNILLKDKKVSGIIDLGEAGIYDRYHDLYWCNWSLGYNQLEDQIPAFWKAYGIDEINTKKLSFMAYINKMSHEL